MNDIQSLAESVVAGQLDSVSLSHWSRYYWNQGKFCHHVNPEGLVKAQASSTIIQRYSGTSEVAHRILYGEPGKAGCVVVKAPPEHSYRGNFGDLLIPLHSHSSDHIAVILDGGGTFLVRRQLEGDDVILMAEAGPGTIMFYPARIPHTFISGEDGICVASAQAEYQSPDSVRFADLAPDYLNELPRLDYALYLRQLSL